jgi:hypothetical protein
MIAQASREIAHQLDADVDAPQLGLPSARSRLAPLDVPDAVRSRPVLKRGPGLIDPLEPSEVESELEGHPPDVGRPVIEGAVDVPPEARQEALAEL